MVVDFDGRALFRVMEQQRQARGLSWQGAANDLWELSRGLNTARPGSRPIAVATIRRLERGETTCQHALFFLRWVARAPEDFLAGPVRNVGPTDLPACGPDHRLRWRVQAMGEALDVRRREERLTWAELAGDLEVQPSQLSGLRTARFGTGMRTAMRTVQWLGVPAAEFVHPSTW